MAHRTPNSIRTRSGPRWRLQVLAALALAILAAGGPLTSPAEAQVCVTGSGSTFAQIMVDAWQAQSAETYGLCVNYQGIGSSGGQGQFATGVSDWISTDTSFLDGLPPRGFTYLPLTAGGTALMYNLRDGAGNRIDGIKLSIRTIARIFLIEDIRSWRDPAILAENPGLAARIPDVPISKAIRGNGSGTTAVFSECLATYAPDLWATFRSQFPSHDRFFGSRMDQFPQGVDPSTQEAYGDNTYRQSSSEGVANFINQPNNNGALGYAEAGYGTQVGLPIAYVQNTSGQWTLPTARNVAVALLNATRNPDGTQNLAAVFTNARPEAYPCSSYNYGVVPTGSEFGFNPEKGAVLGQFVIHAVTEGQRHAARLGYSPLPPNLVQETLANVSTIPGSPPAPPLGNWGRFYEELDVQRPVDPEPPPGGGTENLDGGAGPGGPGGRNGPGNGGSIDGAEALADAAPTAGQILGTSPAVLGADGLLYDEAGNVIGDAESVLRLAPTLADPVFGFRTSRKPLILLAVAVAIGLLLPALLGQPISSRLRRRRAGRTSADAAGP